MSASVLPVVEDDACLIPVFVIDTTGCAEPSVLQFTWCGVTDTVTLEPGIPESYVFHSARKTAAEVASNTATCETVLVRGTNPILVRAMLLTHAVHADNQTLSA